MGELTCPRCGRTVLPGHFYTGGKPRCNGAPNRPGAMRWTTARRWKLLGLVEAGLDNAAIAQEFGLAKDTIRSHMRAHGVPPRARLAYTAKDVAHLLGLDRRDVLYLISTGVLRATEGPAWGRRNRWWVKHNDFERFLQNEAAFHVWEPEQMTDPRWQAVARAARGTERWLSTNEVAEHCFVQRGTVQNWLVTGQLPGRHRTIPGSPWRVREADLLAFTPPQMRDTTPKKRIPKQ